MSSFEISLRDLLRRKDVGLEGRLYKLEEEAKKLLVFTHSKFPYFTNHDFTHSKRVENILNWLILDEFKEILLPYELFLLILASWFHDIGMIGKEEEDPEHIRNVHHIRSEEKIREIHQLLGLNEHEALILGKICKGHRKEDLNTKYYRSIPLGQGVNIRVKLLASLVRLADEFDITNERVSEIMFYELSKNSESVNEYKKHFAVGGIAYDRNLQHKIIFSGTASDPKGSEILEEIEDKLSKTLDSVKIILASLGIIIDVIELDVIPQGFIHKEIKFNISESNILELLVGDHLYRSKDVAFRELLQNAIDACKLKNAEDKSFSSQIIIKKESKEVIEIIDNGIGMGFDNAKNFLSSIGESSINSEEIIELASNANVDLIARFGIGILSSFLMAKKIIVETKKDKFDPCRFIISSEEDTWRYEKGSLVESGTRIKLILKEEFHFIEIEELLRKYIVKPEVSILFQDIKDKKMKKCLDSFNLSYIYSNFWPESFLKKPKKLELLFEINNEDYDIIIGKTEGFFDEGTAIFNHGFFIKYYGRNEFGYGAIILINIKKPILDLHISREDVVRNQKFEKFMERISKDIVNAIQNKYMIKNPTKYYEYIDKIFRKTGLIIHGLTFEEFLEKSPIDRCLLNNLLYPTFIKGKLKYLKLNELTRFKNIDFYITMARDSFFEINYITEFLDKTRNYLFIMNYQEIMSLKKEDKVIKLCEIQFLNLINKNVKISILNYNDILLKLCSLHKHPMEFILPKNIKLVNLDKDLNPIIILKEPGQLEILSDYSGKYFTNYSYINLEPIMKEAFSKMLNYYDMNVTYKSEDKYSSIKLIKKPVFYINAKDPFIKEILDVDIKIIEKDEKIQQLLIRYFFYLTMIIHFDKMNIESMFYFEYLVYLEKEITQFLGIKKNDLIFNRVGIIGKIIFDRSYKRKHFVAWEVIRKKE